MLDLILPNIPPHDHYVEPFFGAGTVFFNKPPVKINTLNDLDGNIVNLFRVLQDDSKRIELLRRLRYTPYARAEYRKACLLLSSERPIDDVTRAWAFFVAQNMGIAHSYYHDPMGRNFGYSRRIRCIHPTNFINRVRNLVEVGQRLKAAQIENEDGIRIMRRYDDPSVFMFIDPPYLSYTTLDKKSPYSTGYNDRLHEELIDFVLSAKSKIMLASYPNELYDKLLNHGWHRIDKEKIIKAAVATREFMAKRKDIDIRPRRIESLYLNYTPSLKLFSC